MRNDTRRIVVIAHDATDTRESSAAHEWVHDYLAQRLMSSDRDWHHEVLSDWRSDA